MDENIVINQIQKTMKEKNISVSELARKLDVSHSTVSLWLNGHRSLNYEKMINISNVLNLELYMLFLDSYKQQTIHLERYFKKFNLDIEEYGQLDVLDQELSLHFRDIVEKYRGKNDYINIKIEKKWEDENGSE